MFFQRYSFADGRRKGLPTDLLHERLLNTNQAAEMLGISRANLSNLSKGGQIPYIQIGRSVRYQIRELMAFRDRRTQTRGR